MNYAGVGNHLTPLTRLPSGTSWTPIQLLSSDQRGSRFPALYAPAPNSLAVEPPSGRCYPLRPEGTHSGGAHG